MKTLYLSGTVGYSINPDKVKNFLTDAKGEDIQVIVNSYGGYVDDAFVIYNLFKQYEGNVEFIVYIAMSAMAYIIMSGDKISGFKNSIFMGHKCWGFVTGDSDEMIREAEIAQGFDNIMAESFIDRMGKSKKDILRAMKDEIWLIGWEQLTAAGIIDDVIDKPEEIEINSDDMPKDFDVNEEFIALDKSQAKVMLLQTFNKMEKDKDRSKAAMKKVAYILKENGNNQDDSDPDKNKTQGDNKMSLKAFLEKNPDAQKEYDEALKAERAEGFKAGVEDGKKNASVAPSNENVAKILKASGVKLTDKMAKALDGKISVEDYAISILEEQKENQAGDQGSGFFGNIAAGQTPRDQATESSKEIEEYDEKVKARAKAIGGGKK